MARVYVGVGSNIDKESSIRSGIQALREAFGELVVSTVYRSAALGFRGADFYNLTVGFDTALSPQDTAALLRDIEARHGRLQAEKGLVSRTLDLDLLLYDDLVLQTPVVRLPREDIVKYAHVLRPLAEIAGDTVHPVLRHSIASLWANFDREKQHLEPVRLDFAGI